MVMVKEKEPKTDPLDIKELENLIVLDPETNNLLDSAKLQADNAAYKKELEDLKAQLALLQAAATKPTGTRRVVNPLETVLGLTLPERIYVLIQLLQKLPYRVPAEEVLDLDSFTNKPIDQRFIAGITGVIESCDFRKRASSKEPNFFAKYLEELGVTVAPKIKAVEVEEECPL